MSLQLSYSPAAPASRCPYRLHASNAEEVDPCNDFLDAQVLRNLSPRSLCSYAYDLRSLFRHHRHRSQVPLANPHRLRHSGLTRRVNRYNHLLVSHPQQYQLFLRSTKTATAASRFTLFRDGVDSRLCSIRAIL